jgi:tetratricopeptide (TPR) repeat protein
MNYLFIILSADGGMTFIMGGLAALFIWGIIALFNSLKPKVESVVTDISLNANPDNVKALIKKGSFEMSKNKWDSAIDYLQKALELSPNNAEALTSIALAYHIKKDYINSKKQIEHYIDLVSASLCEDNDLTCTAIMTYLNGHHFYLEGKVEEAQNCKNSAISFAILDDAKEVINKLNLY